MSGVRCNLYVYIYIFFFYKVVKLIGGGSVINVIGAFVYFSRIITLILRFNILCYLECPNKNKLFVYIQVPYIS